MELVALTLDTLGKIMISFTAIMVHHRVLIEKSVDAQVLVEMKREQYIGIGGVILILAAYFIKLSFHL